MAWTAATAWEYRPDGPALGGAGIGFDPSFGGTDLSQSITPALTVTDAAGTGITTVTSTTGGFTATMKGNGLNVNGQLYQITAVASTNSITVDRATGTFSGQTANVGGCGACKGTATSSLEPLHYGVTVVGQKHYFKATNSSGVATAFTPAGTVVFGAGAQWNSTLYEGYTTTRGDGGIADFGASVAGNANAVSYAIIKNLKFRGASGGTVMLAGGTGQYLENLIIDASAFASTYALSMGTSSTTVCRRLLVKCSTGTAANLRENAGATYEFCNFHSAGQLNVSLESGNTPKFRYCVIDGGSTGVQVNNNSSSMVLQNSVIWHCTNAGLDFPVASLHDGEGLLVENCILGRNGTYDVSHTNTSITASAGAQAWVDQAFRCNWFYTTGTGRYFQMPAASDDHALTINPFTDDSAGSFALNSSTGGGADIRSTACATSWPDGLNTTSITAGPYGTISAGTDSALTQMRSLWRELTNERFSTLVDAVVDIWLDFGLQALNRAAHYHVSDGTVTLVAGTQEYSLPSDFILAQWLATPSLRKLERGDTERWMSRGEDWRHDPLGEPAAWALYSNKLILRPTPSAEAVAASATLTLRYVSTPPTISTYGPEQLGSEEYRLVVIYGAMLFGCCYPDSGATQLRIAELRKEWDAALPQVIQEYAQRNIGS